MNDQQKSKKQLIEELLELRKRLEKLETTKAPLCQHLDRRKIVPSDQTNHENHQHNDDFKVLKKTELALRASEERNHKLLSSLPDLLFLLSKEGNYLDHHVANTSLLYTSLDARQGTHISEILPADPSERIMIAITKAVNTSKTQFLEYQLSINNTVYFFEGRIINYDTDNILLIVRDITELKRLRQEITRLDQLNLVGEMAASIGHEVRHPLTTVRGFLQLLSKKKECTSFKEYFDLMIDELDRANSIISEFLSLAKNKTVKLEPQNLNTIIKTISPLIESNATITNKNLVLDLSPIPDSLLDSQEIRQLILNLVHNGLESMPPHTSLIIKTSVEKNQVVLSIQDEGTGIPPELIEKLGTPFFTTKESGTGLGLAICYRIAARHNATIEVSTSPQGTTFSIKFNQ